MSAGFTKGPWGIGLWNGSVVGTASGMDHTGPHAAVFCEKGMIAPTGNWNDDESRANAHLIAAAPDMYDAMEAMLSEFCRQSDTAASDWRPDSPAGMAFAALAKARGEA